MHWTRFSNPRSPDEADLDWLLLPVNGTGRSGPERDVPQLGRVRFPLRVPSMEVSLYRDPYGSHRFVGRAAGVPVAGLQVVKAPGRPAVVANVYVVPRERGKGLASALLGFAPDLRHRAQL